MSSKSKCPGPDPIPFAFLQNMSKEQHNHLLNFDNIWKTHIPALWKEAVICHILKPEKPPTDPESYRSIALTNTLCKLFEKMVTPSQQIFLEQGNYITQNQSSFRAGHSTLDELCRLQSAIRTALIQNDYCVAVFIDIVQAFDTVWHSGFKQKLQMMGLNGNLPLFITDFLTQRSIKV